MNDEYQNKNKRITYVEMSKTGLGTQQKNKLIIKFLLLLRILSRGKVLLRRCVCPIIKNEQIFSFLYVSFLILNSRAMQIWPWWWSNQWKFFMCMGSVFSFLSTWESALGWKDTLFLMNKQMKRKFQRNGRQCRRLALVLFERWKGLKAEVFKNEEKLGKTNRKGKSWLY